jgi:hypothetical protein
MDNVLVGDHQTRSITFYLTNGGEIKPLSLTFLGEHIIEMCAQFLSTLVPLKQLGLKRQLQHI